MSHQITDIIEYFPNLSDDLSKVTWGHAINDATKLQENIKNSTVMMLEADILMGHVEGDTKGNKIPIMAHPPDEVSDISFQDWMDQVIEVVNKNKMMKGVKLDFKDNEALMPSLNILQRQKNLIKFPMLLNADILPGPGNPANSPLDADTFLNTCTEFFPEATLSVGWTTKFSSAVDPSGIYTMEMAKSMAEKLTINGVGQPVTFPIRAAFVGRSLEALEYLIDNVEDSTITIWSSATDTVDIEALVKLRDLVGHDVVYYDLPSRQMKEFNDQKTKDEEETLLQQAPNMYSSKGFQRVITSPYTIMSFVGFAIIHYVISFIFVSSR